MYGPAALSYTHRPATAHRSHELADAVFTPLYSFVFGPPLSARTNRIEYRDARWRGTRQLVCPSVRRHRARVVTEVSGRWPGWPAVRATHPHTRPQDAAPGGPHVTRTRRWCYIPHAAHGENRPRIGRARIISLLDLGHNPYLILATIGPPWNVSIIPPSATSCAPLT